MRRPGSGRGAGIVSVGMSAILALILFLPSDPAVPKSPVPPPAKPAPPPENASAIPLTAVAIRLPPPPVAALPKPPAPKPASSPAAALPKPASIAVPEIIPETITPETITPETITEGRALLRLLEHGKGPSIEIAWPASAAVRGKLYRVFRGCFGMKTALMDGNQQLFDYRGASGIAWAANLDRYSGFMRRPVGVLPPAEAKLVATIRRHHRPADPVVVRLFPRHVDAVLIGTLKRLLDRRYQSAKTIRARYEITGAAVAVSGIAVDGTAVPGRLELPVLDQRRCPL